MLNFCDGNFLLTNQIARRLYHGYAEFLPIIDYHCHLIPQEIAENKNFGDLTQVWLGADHYKWRLMRFCGIDEQYITGEADSFAKFEKFAECLPTAIGNPMYHWCHLELRRYFDCDLVINKQNAREIYDVCSAQLAKLTPVDIMKQSHVEVVCTTDSPGDSLEYHEYIAKNIDSVKVYPAFRPDSWLQAGDYDYDYIKAEIDKFDKHGCRAADQVIEQSLVKDSPKYKAMVFLLQEYAKRGWVCELHLGALRNTNSAQMAKLGVNTGYDVINSQSFVNDVAMLLDEVNSKNALPKTVIFSLNPTDNAAITTLSGSFTNVQQGAAWWFSDSLPGMREHLTNFAATSVMGIFLGMLTDSRSFLSYPRHEYFRRIFCNFVGELVECGQYPNDEQALQNIVENVCYNNAKNISDCKKRTSFMTFKEIFKSGIYENNPTLVQVLGTCPTLAVTSSVENGIGMGLAATAVLVMSNILISLLRRVIPEKIRIAAFIVVIAAFVTLVDLLMQAYTPALSETLGIFIPLIVVNCVILARAEAYASKNSVGKAAVDGLGMGLGFTVALVIISSVRELLGSGTWLGFVVFSNYQPMLIMLLAPGGFLTFGLVLALIAYFKEKRTNEVQN